MFFFMYYKEYTNILKNNFEDKTLQCNNCNKRIIIHQLLHVTFEIVVCKKTLQVYNNRRWKLLF